MEGLTSILPVSANFVVINLTVIGILIQKVFLRVFQNFDFVIRIM